jgi:hypothetical protein
MELTAALAGDAELSCAVSHPESRRKLRSKKADAILIG